MIVEIHQDALRCILMDGLVIYLHNLMNYLDESQKILLVSDSQSTYALEKPYLKIKGQYKRSFRLGSLQYCTGIAALGKGSLIQIYDFKLQRAIEQIETYLELEKLCIIKNLVIAVSQKRILIHDLETKANLCFIQTFKGSNAAIHSNYYDLKVIYPVEPHLFEERDIWGNRTTKYEFHETEGLHYDETGKITCFVNKNVASLYESDEIIKGCSFNSEISEVRQARNCKHRGGFYFMTKGGGKHDQPLFVEFNDCQKNYLKFRQTLVGREEEMEGPEKGMMFNYECDVYLWKGRQVLKGSVDEEPEFSGNESVSQIVAEVDGEQKNDVN